MLQPWVAIWISRVKTGTRYVITSSQGHVSHSLATREMGSAAYETRILIHMWHVEFIFGESFSSLFIWLSLFPSTFFAGIPKEQLNYRDHSRGAIRK